MSTESMEKLGGALMRTLRSLVEREVKKREPELRGPKGDKGDAGENGEHGIDGRDGKNGEPGRDALQIDVLQSIEPNRSYARGTFASHFGGLWRAVRTSDDVADGATAADLQKAGWACIVEGRRPMQMEQRGDRTFVFKDALSSGHTTELVARLPLLIDRGVYDHDRRDYEIGDSVTFAGCLWAATKDGPTRKPGTEGSDDWRLIVKKGKDGRDGKNGEKGERGERGKSWDDR